MENRNSSNLFEFLSPAKFKLEHASIGVRRKATLPPPAGLQATDWQEERQEGSGRAGSGATHYWKDTWLCNS